MKTRFVLALVALVVSIAPQAAFADVTTFNQNLGGNGVYYGTGNDDGNFTITLANYAGGTLQLGLRGHEAFVGNITPTGGNNYACASPKNCNFDYSVATTGSLHVGDFTYQIKIHDLDNGLTLAFDPLNDVFDNTYWEGGETPVKNVATATGFQNSEPAGVYAYDRLEIYFSATSVADVTADVSMGFNTSVPEPSALVLTSCFAGFLGFASLLVRKFQKV